MFTSLLKSITLREWQHHPWRHGVALMAVALGVALAYSVHLINRSALAEFASAVRAVNGQPDLSLRGPPEGFDDALFERLVGDRDVAIASPMVEIDTYVRLPGAERLTVKVIGIDALLIASLAPQLMPRPDAGADRLSMLDPDVVFANAAALDKIAANAKAGTGAGTGTGNTMQLQSGLAWQTLRLGGSVPSGGPPLLVMDIAGAQSHFGMAGKLSRIDLRLLPGADRAALLARWALPANVAVVQADESEQRVSNLSRAYRVNLTVLALVALFVGAFLVFSVVSLSVAQRTPAFALLGVLGLTAAERRRLVLGECALLGAAGSLLGLLIGLGLAVLALRWLAGDLGGGYFPGITPQVQFEPVHAAAFAMLGTLSAVIGGWVPARQAERIAPALALKGLGTPGGVAPPAWPGLALLAAGAALAFAPPIGGLPVAAYASVAALLFGGVALVPAVVHGLLAGVPAPRGPLVLLALQRARFQRHTASAAVAGVVASLALSVALTVMVTSFRSGVAAWLDSVLPADLYARTASSSAASDQAWLDAALVQRATALPGVLRVQASRTRALQLSAALPAVVLVARPLDPAEQALPFVDPPLPPREGEVGIYVSEAVVALYGARVGQMLSLPLGTGALPCRVLGVWRDFARQFGTIAIDITVYRRITGDERLNDLALWLAPGTDNAKVQAGLRALMPDPAMLQFAASAELRRISLRIFDRSFAVTYYLQAVAVAIGLVGIAASLSAQVLARRKEFGLLAHLGLTRAQVVAVVAGEAAAWMAAGTLVGLLLGLALSMVLVFVVNPQSFHWSMDLVLPWARLAALCGVVWAAGVATAAWSARRAAGHSAVLSVKEDW